jgi:hypothetical protein
MKKIFSLICFTLVFAFAAKAQTADEIVKKYLDNIGGADKLRALSGTKMSSKINAMGMELPLEIINLKNGKMLVKFELQGKEMVQQAFDGTTAWGVNFMTMKPEKSDNEATENMKRETADFPDPFLDYKIKGFKIESLGKETVEGVECFKIKLTKKPQLSEGMEVENVHFYYFDTENYVPVLSETEVKTGQYKGMVSQTVFSDYQEVGGIYFPFSITNKAKGQGEGQTLNVTKVELNPKVDEKIFIFTEGKN